MQWYCLQTANGANEGQLEIQEQSLDYDVMMLSSFVGTTRFIVGKSNLHTQSNVEFSIHLTSIYIDDLRS